jgi:hypothetical protein
MKTPILSLIIIALAAPGAFAQAVTQQQVEKAMTGVWKCETNADGNDIKSETTYLASGKETFKTSYKGVSPVPMEFESTGTADWKVLPDGKLTETVTAITITSGKMNGADVPAETLQSMIAPMIVNQTSTNTVTALKDKAMTMVEAAGTPSTCTR